MKDIALTWEETIEQRGIETLRQLVLRLLIRRFGAVPESVRQRVEALDSTESLTEVGVNLLDANSIAEMGLG